MRLLLVPSQTTVPSVQRGRKPEHIKTPIAVEIGTKIIKEHVTLSSSSFSLIFELQKNVSRDCSARPGVGCEEKGLASIWREP